MNPSKEFLTNIMVTPNMLQNVREFQLTFNNNVEPYPTLSTQGRRKLRVDLIQEELNEMKDALIDSDIVEVADALADLMYVVTGSILEFGLGDIFLDIFNEVHRSNMTKACIDLKEAQETMDSYKEKGIETSYFEKEGKFIVFNTENDKTLKSVNYSPANIKPIIERAFKYAPEETDMPDFKK